MKKTLFISLLFLILFSCNKDTTTDDVPEETNKEIFDPKKSFIKFISNNPVAVLLPRYVYMDFKVAYNISTEALSAQGFKISGTLSIDNQATRFQFYSQELYVRTDTVDIRYRYLNTYSPKDSIRIIFSLLQRTSPNNYIVLSRTDSLVYKLAPLQ